MKFILDKRLILVACATLLVSSLSYARGGEKSADTQSGATTGAQSEEQMAAEDRSPAAAQQEKVHSEALTFKKDQATLDKASQQKLSDLVSQAKQAGEIDKISVAVWSDQEFPKQGQQLSQQQRDLAETRIENIENHIKDQLNVSNVETYNMSERSNWLARAFNTDEAELKSMFAQRGGTPISNKQFEAIRKDGGPSKAVAVVTLKQKQRMQEESGTTGEGSGMMDTESGATQDEMAPSESGTSAEESESSGY